MENVIMFVASITQEQIFDIILATCIVILFFIFASTISKIILNLCKLKRTEKKSPRESAFYMPLIILTRFLGIYVAITVLKNTFQVSEAIMIILNKLFVIILTIAFSKALMNSFTMDSYIVKKYLRKSKKEVKESMLNFSLKTIRVVITLSSATIVLNTVGINVTSIIAGLGISSIVISLSAQDTIKNIIGGFMIFLDKPFEVGDWIQYDKYEGLVEDVTFRSTRIRNIEDTVAHVPNSVITNAVVTNWSKLKRRRYTSNLMIGIHTSLNTIEEFENRVYDILLKNKKVVPDTISINIDNVTTNGINIKISTYINCVEYDKFLTIAEEINKKLIEELNAKILV